MIFENGYDTIQGYECLNSCITNYFNYYRIPVLGSDIFFGGKGFEISYRLIPKPTIGSRLYESNFKFMEKMMISYEHSKCKNNIDAICFLEKCIINEICVAIKVSTEYLEYNSVFKQTQGSQHYLNVIGIDNEKIKFYISDGYVPTYRPTVFQGWVDASRIMLSWSSMSYEYVIVPISDVHINIPAIKNITNINVRCGIENYLATNSHQDIVYGESSILKLIEDLKLRFEKSNDLRKAIIDINYQLKIYGFITSKIYLYEYMINIKVGNLSEKYLAIIERWNKICLFLLKVGFAQKSEQYDILYKKIDALVSYENIILKQIYEAL